MAQAPIAADLGRSARARASYRAQKARRLTRKAGIVTARGGRCVDCGYARCLAAIEFHHRDPSTKEFALGEFTGSLERLLREAEKCDLVCANCHRIRHAAFDAERGAHPVVRHRRRRKARAVAFMGATCDGCGRGGPPAMFEFHHLNAHEKDFGIGQDGIPRRWEAILAELAKCVMLCANCHREVHAGMREIDDGLLGLAEDALPYAA